MIVCSCAVISDHDIEVAVLDIMSGPDAPIPTPGVVYRQLEKKLKCCGCLPITVAVIYEKLEALEAKGLICPYASANARNRLQRHRERARARSQDGRCEPETVE